MWSSIICLDNNICLCRKPNGRWFVFGLVKKV
jgi:hypothetical protein